MKTFLMLSVFAGLAAAQPFGAGVKLGGTLTDAISFKTPGLGSKGFVGGPYVELRLPAGFALEADALYTSGVLSGISTGGTSWQFPVLLKYHFSKGIVRPYVEGGVAFSTITGLAKIPELNHRDNFGVVLGAGLEIHAAFLRISPEIRYNGSFLKNFQSPTGLLESNRNQVAVLVGIGF